MNIAGFNIHTTLVTGCWDQYWLWSVVCEEGTTRFKGSNMSENRTNTGRNMVLCLVFICLFFWHFDNDIVVKGWNVPAKPDFPDLKK